MQIKLALFIDLAQRTNVSQHYSMGLICFLFTIFSALTMSSQTFTDITNGSGINHSFLGEYGCGASFVDFDGDGWDDISICSEGDLHFYKNENGTFVQLDSLVYNSAQAKHLTWVDFDNDGDKDLFVTKEYAPFRLYQNNGDLNLVDITEEAGFPETFARTNGHSWGDYNNDGYLDLFVCNYDHQSNSNWFFENNGDGTFTDVTEELGFDSTMEFSFQSVFMDINNDGWQDLVVINDKVLHPNRMYRNDGGSFTDITVEAGFNYQVNAMSNTVGDFDNDGWQDIFISDANTNLLHHNNGDETFDEIAQGAGLNYMGFTWGGLFIDVDNNALLDLVICTSPEFFPSGKNHLFMNNGDETFSYNFQSGLGNQLTYSFTPIKGDINNDGYSDLFITGSNGNQSNLYVNNGSGSNYLKVNLEGTISNRDGIGSTIQAWHNDTMQSIYTFCGESYFGQNSNTKIFGLGQAQSVDSLKITWLSGVVDKFYDLEVNQTINVIEGQTLSNQISYNGSTNLCFGDSIVLHAGDFESFEWSNGADSESITVYTSGEYYVTVVDQFGFELNSDTVEVEVNPVPIISADVDHVSCNGFNNGSINLVNLTTVEAESCTWSNGAEGLQLDSLGPGSYSYEFVDINGCESEGTVTIYEPEPLEIEITTENQIGETPGSAQVEVSGGTPPFNIYWSNGEQNTNSLDSLSSGYYGIWIVDANKCKTYTIFLIDLINDITAANDESITVFPNPFGSDFSINGLPSGKVEVTAFYSDGSVAFKRICSPINGKVIVSCQGVSQGILFLEIRYQNKRWLEQVVKN